MLAGAVRRFVRDWATFFVGLLLVYRPCRGQYNYYDYYNQPGPSDNNYGDNQAYDTVYDSADYDAGEDSYAPSINCYYCNIHIEDGHIQGYTNCDEDFDPTGIEIMPCTGPCAKIRYAVKPYKEENYAIVRTCQHNCKETPERDDETKTVIKCCTEDLCNGSNSSFIQGNLVIIKVISGLLSLVYLFVMH